MFYVIHMLLICHYVATGIFPDSLKLARVTPIPKGDESTNDGNHRPISDPYQHANTVWIVTEF